MSKKEFQAESKRLLDLMIHSIYTNREIFLRELISNASDALDKRAYRALTGGEPGLNRNELEIRILPDREARTLTVSDNGVGMDAQALEENLGVIAKSGSLQFKKSMADQENKPEEIDIIGQFGVGFYSAFMVSDTVTVRSRACGSDTAWEWVSSGAEGYEIRECSKDSIGTEIIMQLKPDTEEENYSRFLEEHTLRRLVKKYSDYIRYPINMDVEKRRPVKTAEDSEDKAPEFETYIENETLNDRIPIWHKQKSEVSDEDYNQFYKEKFSDYDNPLKTVHVSTEGVVSYEALLFVPSRTPYDYYTKDYEKGLQLYSSGVLIMDRCAELLPEHFRFVRGVVDSQDLSLNISREMLQQNRQVQVIAGNIEKKIKRELLKMLENERESYETFFKNFGLQLKYGVAGEFGAHKDDLKDLLLFYSSTEQKMVSLAEYASRMKEDQKFVYYACADTIIKADRLPQTETIKAKGYEILYLTDEVDDFVMQILHELDGKEIKSVSSDDITDEEERKTAEEQTKEHKELLDFVKDSLNGKVKEVRFSEKLKTHPVFLSSDGAISLEMEKYFAQANPEGGMKAEHILELNASHPVLALLKEAFASDKEHASQLSELLYQLALLIAGFPIEDPTAYADLVCALLAGK